MQRQASSSSSAVPWRLNWLSASQHERSAPPQGILVVKPYGLGAFKKRRCHACASRSGDESLHESLDGSGQQGGCHSGTDQHGLNSDVGVCGSRFFSYRRQNVCAGLSKHEKIWALSTGTARTPGRFTGLGNRHVRTCSITLNVSTTPCAAIQRWDMSVRYSSRKLKKLKPVSTEPVAAHSGVLNLCIEIAPELEPT